METMTKPPLRFTRRAVSEIERLMHDKGFDHNSYLRIGVKGGGCSGLSYVLDFDKKMASDEHYDFEGLPFIMNPAHGIYLMDMEIDWEGGLNARGFTFKNPNASKTCGCGHSFGV